MQLLRRGLRRDDGAGWSTRPRASAAAGSSLAHEGGYSAVHVPFCGLAVIEALSGLDTGVDDPFAYVEGQEGQELQPHQREAVECRRVPRGAHPGVTPKLVLVLSENWTIVDARSLRALVEMAVVAEDGGLRHRDDQRARRPRPLLRRERRDGEPPRLCDAGQPGPCHAVAELARPALGDRGGDDAHSARCDRRARAAPAPAAAREGTRDARHPRRGPPRRTAHRQLAPGRVRGARRPVRETRAPARRAPGRMGCSLARVTGELRRRALQLRRRVARAESVAGGRAAHLARRRVRASPAAAAHRRARPRVPPAGDAERGRHATSCGKGSPRPDATSPSSSSSAACAPRFPDDRSPAPLGPAIAALPPLWERGFRTFCIKPNQYIDDLADYPRWCAEVVERVGELDLEE